MAQATWSNVSVTPLSGTVDAVTGTMTVVATGSVVSTASQDAIEVVRLYYDNVEVASQRFTLTYTGTSEYPNNLARKFSLSVPVSAGTHTIRLGGHVSTSDQIGYTSVYTINAAPAAVSNGATYVRQSVPTSMVAGQNYSVSVTMRNSGTSTWTAAGNNYHALGSHNPTDNGTFGLSRVLVPSSIAPGAEATFSFTAKAPSTPGSYNFQWRMLQENVEWFGDVAPNVAITVTAPQSAAPTISVSPGTLALTAGQSATVTWSTTNATSVTRSCVASGTGYSGSVSLATSGSRSETGNASWVGYPSTCTWTATGAGGSVSVTQTMATSAASGTNECLAETPASGTYTAAINGATVWGNNSTGYTTDSNVAAALAHSGLLAPGASGNITITSLGKLSSYTGTTANGVTTSSYGAAWCGMKLSLVSTPTPTITVSPTAMTLVAGQSSTVTWSTTNATSVTRSCTAAGTGLAGTVTLASSGTRSETGSAAYVGYPSTCTWTATGPGGSKTVTQTITTNTTQVSAACLAQTPASGTYTGSLSGGTVWGNNSGGYTTDSSLPRALVHSGLLAVGQSGSITITPLDRLSSFTGTTANGVTTTSYGSWCGMRLSLANATPVVTLSAPANYSEVVAIGGSTAAVSIQGSASGGTIGTLQLLDGTTVIDTVTGTSTYNKTINLAAGPHVLTLKAINSANQSGTSDVVNVFVHAQVSGNSAVAGGLSIPSTMRAGQPYTVTVKMLNNGTTTWSEASAYRLGSQNAQDNTVWGAGRAFLEPGATVAPGAMATFTLAITAPKQAGTYNFQWQMLQEFVSWFGAKTVNLPIAVSIGAGPGATLAASPNNVRVSGNQTQTVTFTGSGSSSTGTVAKAELFQNSGRGYGGTPVGSATGSQSSLAFSKALSLPAGIYGFRLRVTDSANVPTDSDEVFVNITNSSLLGTVSGIRTNAAGAPELFGWTCQQGNAAALGYKVLLDSPSPYSSGLQIAEGMANVTSERDNASVAAQCGSGGHHFVVDLSSYVSNYAGRAIYIYAYTADGATTISLPCANNNCTVPGSLRVALSSPTANAIFGLPQPAFLKMKLTNYSGTFDELGFMVNGQWVAATADGAAGEYSAQKTLAASATPYTVYAVARQGRTTVRSVEVPFYMSSGTSIAVTAPLANTTLTVGSSQTLNATVSGSTIASVRFQVGSTQIAASNNSGVWSAVWGVTTAGNFNVVAYAYDSGGTLLAQSAPVAVTVKSSANGGTDTPQPVNVNTPHLSNAMAGTLPGELGINNGGAATYSIPIVVPPGTAGLQPQVSLNYNSQGGNSIVGLGWSLSGTSRIQRCGQTIAQDGVNARINFTLSDRLCLDGQRLVLVNQTMSDANYWSDTAEYRTESDSFSRITAQGSSSQRSFKVQSKDGRITTYGGSTSSVVKAIVKEVGAGVLACNGAVACKFADKSGPIGWAVDSIKDRYGNYINYNYTQDANSGEHVLADIRYGGNGLNPHAAVVFTTESRADAWTRYIDGARNDLRVRVRSIATYVGDNLSASATSGTRVRQYSLSYERSPTSGRSLLNKVSVVARNPQTQLDDTLPATIFNWGKPDPGKTAGFEAPVTFSGGPRLSQLTTDSPANNKIHANLFAFTDFNGDGYGDILEKSVAPLYRNIPQTELRDHADRALKTSYRYFHNNGGTGFVEYRYRLNTNEAFGVSEIADFNGDGAPDVLAWNGSKLKICLSPLANGQGPGTGGSTIVFTCRDDLLTTGGVEGSNSPFVTDIRGDGRSGLYGRVLVSSNPSTVCMQTQCTTVDNPQGEVVGFGYANDGSPEFYRHDYAAYASMVDFGGVGKPFDTRFSQPQYLTYLLVDNVSVDYRRWINLRPSISMVSVNEPGSTVSNSPMTGYSYNTYPSPASTTRAPYSFEKNDIGLGLDADFNGSGYSSLALGFREHTYANDVLGYTKAEFNLCLSTGNALDCRIRQKYSGVSVGSFDGAGSAARMRYLAVKGVGNFIGDGQPSVLAMSMVPSTNGSTITDRTYMCRVMGDDNSTQADGADDSNIACDVWGNNIIRNAGTGDQTFFMDVLGTGRTQLVYYHEDWQSSQPNAISYSWSVAKPVDVAVTGQALDRIHAVTNGLGATSTVTYSDGLASGAVSLDNTLATTLAYSQHLSSGVGKYATRLSKANGVGDALVSTYSFRNPVNDVTGRGAMGFASVTVKDEQTQVQTDTDYEVVWPLAGMARKVVVSRGSRILSQTENSNGVIKIDQGNGQFTNFPVVQRSKVQRWDLTGDDMGTTTTTGLAGGETSIAYDNYGNQRSSRVVVSGGGAAFTHTTDTVHTYSSDIERLYLGLPDSTVVTKSHNAEGGTAIARKVAYTYETTGKIKTQTVQPDDATLALKTTFFYDSKWGVVTDKQLDWQDPDTGTASSRVDSTITYDAKGRYPYTIDNALRHREVHGYDAGTGARVSLTNPDSLTTSWEVDGFGRVTRELRADGNETRSYLKQCAGDCQASAAAVQIVEQYHGGDRIAVPQVSYIDTVGHILDTLTWGFDGSEIRSGKSYNAAGLPLEEQVPHFGSSGVPAVHNEYDEINRPALVRRFNEDGSNADTVTEYKGLKLKVTNPKRQVRTENKNVIGLTVSVENELTLPSKRTLLTQFSYDAWGNLVKTIDPRGNVIRIKYDTLGRKIQLKDPDLGQIDYSVNPLGLVWKQVNPVQRAKAALANPPANPYTRTKYDALNRMTDRIEDDLQSHWIYQTAAPGIGQLAEAYTGTSASPDYRRVHTYDGLGRPSSVRQYLLDGSYVSTPKYDAWSRVIGLTYQRGSDAAKEFIQRYNNFGYLSQVERSGLVLWQADALDASLRTTRATLGNGLVETDTYNNRTGRLTGSLTAAGSQIRLQEDYLYDTIGNVSQRSQYWGSQGFIEQFEYDDLNRLTQSKIGTAAKVFTYDDSGNVTSRTGLGTTYNYPAPGDGVVRPHAVSSITGVSGTFNYDANGNLVRDPWRTISWNNFDMPVTITKGSSSSTFAYGPEHQRTRQTKEDGSIIVYGGGQEVELTSARAVKSVKTYWPLGLGVEIDRPGQTATELRWTHKDRLGSPVAISGETGTVLEMLAYDAWGKRRQPDGSAIPDNLDGVIDNKGFTGHEMLDQLDLVHMNGRVYDPLVARFMSGDPLIQNPLDGQSYNRYSYVLNNPTNLTDPTGFACEPTIGSRISECNAFEKAAAKCKEACVVGSKDKDGSFSPKVRGNGKGDIVKYDKNMLQKLDAKLQISVTEKQASANTANYSGGGAAERSVERFRKDAENGNSEVYAPLRPYAIAVTGAALGVSGVAAAATSTTGRAFLAMLGFGTEAQNVADGAPPAGRGIAGVEARAAAAGAATSVEANVSALSKGESIVVQMNPKNLISQQSKNEMSGSVIKRLEKDMRANGFDANEPISAVVRADGRVVISDGHHRVQAAIRAGIMEIPVDVYKP